MFLNAKQMYLRVIHKTINPVFLKYKNYSLLWRINLLKISGLTNAYCQFSFPEYKNYRLLWRVNLLKISLKFNLPLSLII